MKCGHCKADDEMVTVNHVRHCSTVSRGPEHFQPKAATITPLPSTLRVEAPAAKVTEDGFYQAGDGTIYKVQRSGSSGHLYAKRLVLIEQEDGTKKGRFDFQPGAIRSLLASMKLTGEAAREFGKLYGVCCVCGATLENEVSIAAGIGPVCGGRI